MRSSLRRDPDFLADLDRYPARPFLREQSIWAVAVYRFGRQVDGLPAGVRRSLLTKLYWAAYRIVETVTGISITKSVAIGPGLRIWHFGNVMVHPDVHIGARCTLRHGVTIGDRNPGGGVPTIGDDVEFGAYAQVLGPVHVGDHCRIGAMAVVVHDVPAGATAVGNPARIVR